MASGAGSAIETHEVHGTKLRVETSGAGRDVLFLSSGSWFSDDSAFVERLSRRARVIAPIAPGFGADDAGRRFTTVDDLAYLYLDLIDVLKLRNPILAGASFGGWIAAEMAVKTCQSIGKLALIDALGVKFGGREDRDIADLYGIADPELLRLAYADQSNFNTDVKSIDDAELSRRMRARESLARYGWIPFMHDPKLVGRLHRVSAPTLVLWGRRDGIVSPDYGRKYAQAIPGARFDVIENAGHFPHIEQPDAVSEAILAFAG
jgi:pimeloyl-ACP methyl ester carboxylesterase